VRPLFAAFGVNCSPTDIDTDEFGTFSGEVERKRSVRETLRSKINAALKVRHSERLFLASEGSFGPHPSIGFLQTDLESLLFFDRVLEIEIYAEYLDVEPNHAERAFAPSDDFRAFLEEIGFPEHGVIVHSEGKFVNVFKGLHSEHAVGQAMLDCFWAQPDRKVMIATDLRANHSPTRQKAILKAGEALVEKLKSLCPGCGLPGFAISRGIPGLPCSACGEPSATAKKVLWECVKCEFREERARPDLKAHIEPGECEHCNP
jgi:hypothetical protein